MHDVCSAITKVDAIFWLDKDDECTAIVARHFLSHYIPIRNILIIITILWHCKVLSTLVMCRLFRQQLSYSLKNVQKKDLYKMCVTTQ